MSRQRLSLAAGVLILSLLPAMAQGPAPRTETVPMRDGIRLASDVYLPGGSGPFPTILVRTVYGKSMGKSMASQATDRGYALVVQDTRGRFASQGANRAFEADGWFDGKEDGYDTVEWIAKQPWSNGKVGTWGGSALGITQLLMAGAAPPHLTCQHITVAAPSLYQEVAFRGGAYRSEAGLWLQVSGFDPAQQQVWTDHPTYDAYWREHDLATRWGTVNVPAVHVGGWYDLFCQGSLDAYEGYQVRGGPGARGYQKLIMGPWTHAVGNPRVGSVTFPSNAARAMGTAGTEWTWFDHWLKGKDNGADREPAVEYYVMGDTTDLSAPGNVWRTASRWPVPSTVSPWYLTASRALGPIRHTGRSSSLEYAYDPTKPVPTTGGTNLILSAGPMDQRKVEERPDVLVFTSTPLQQPLEVTGRVKARLWVSSDCPDTDFVARLCDVYPDGRSLNICDGILRARYRSSLSAPQPMKPGTVYPVDIDLWSTSMVFNKGHKLRLQVTSSNAPAYEPNPNTGAAFRADKRTRVAHNRIWMDAGHPSHVLLPVVTGAP